MTTTAHEQDSAERARREAIAEERLRALEIAATRGGEARWRMHFAGTYDELAVTHTPLDGYGYWMLWAAKGPRAWIERSTALRMVMFS